MTDEDKTRQEEVKPAKVPDDPPPSRNEVLTRSGQQELEHKKRES
jgi:hypothetical protein